MPSIRPSRYIFNPAYMYFGIYYTIISLKFIPIFIFYTNISLYFV
ncbi:hypothetical protein CLOBOL_00017 [Enterocloster bolteae ATCC BAA-613]|uniref:Uncharacterized protein n=1 Tax=Enterocloster bolteae (strain ATCC BAA-613 / DSM 15670 / CCUG 46953 / JCM 12243 / WAL 16351) TaxID=411902 RepID=A8RG13_ENTBW|nr:hypothetical protein CLOBOL_00017 [Enterocloster bolteae ATCC BAA-613]